MLKDLLFKTSRWQFDDWLFGPKKFSGLSRNKPQDFLKACVVVECIIFLASTDNNKANEDDSFKLS